MKQNITDEQYYESKQIRRNLEDIGLMKAEEVTIGKMMEILEQRFSSIYTRKFKEERKYQICIDPIELYMKGFKIVRTFDSEQLCDALWEAVKVVLGVKQNAS